MMHDVADNYGVFMMRCLKRDTSLIQVVVHMYIEFCTGSAKDFFVSCKNPYPSVEN